jgi:glycosyltransferase involved in cell wall biosynthesis
MGGIRELADGSRLARSVAHRSASDNGRRALSLLVPGDPATETGGYIYDRRIVSGLRRLGWRAETLSLDASFPQPTRAALDHARGVLARLPDGKMVAVDGLALGGLSAVLESEARRLCLIALIHHPVALETGLDPETAKTSMVSERAALRCVRRVVVTSRWTARRLADYGVTPRRIRVVPPGIDGPDAGRSRHETRAVMQGRDLCDPPSLDLLCVATLTPRKGHDVLFDALAELADRPWHLNCIGSLTRDPETADGLRRRIERLGLGPRIALLGEVDRHELDRQYARCDLFVLASHLEGYGMALAEAVAAGIPVVSTEAGAIPETVPRSAGVLVPPGDRRALAAALAGLMDDSKTRRRLASNALRARRRFSTWNQASRRFAAAIEDLVSRAG